YPISITWERKHATTNFTMMNCPRLPVDVLDIAQMDRDAPLPASFLTLASRLDSRPTGTYHGPEDRLSTRVLIMRERKYLFPHVIEMNYEAVRRLGVNVYLIDGGSKFLLIDIGFMDTVDEIVELIRQMDFNLAKCQMIVATHADADHIQGVARA